ncbi:MAG: tRNA (guanosine(37)-N1)-methyltransferase TrmD [Bryobacteraceae bacterium]
MTIFPEYFYGMFDHGVVGRAVRAGAVTVNIHNLRDWTFDKHKTVDDRPFGGGEGMLLKPEPLFAAIESILPGRSASGAKVVLLSAQGKRFDQAVARRLTASAELLLICGRYEGVDERVAEHLADEELSIGDYILSGGELPAAVIIDCMSRLVPGVVGNEASTVNESFREVDGRRMLDCPQYTRPAEFRGWKVPEVLLGGNHAGIAAWRRETALAKTARNRPDLLGEPDSEI